MTSMTEPRDSQLWKAPSLKESNVSPASLVKPDRTVVDLSFLSNSFFDTLPIDIGPIPRKGPGRPAKYEAKMIQAHRRKQVVEMSIKRFGDLGGGSFSTYTEWLRNLVTDPHAKPTAPGANKRSYEGAPIVSEEFFRMHSLILQQTRNNTKAYNKCESNAAPTPYATNKLAVQNASVENGTSSICHKSHSVLKTVYPSESFFSTPPKMLRNIQQNIRKHTESSVWFPSEKWEPEVDYQRSAIQSRVQNFIMKELEDNPCLASGATEMSEEKTQTGHFGNVNLSWKKVDPEGHASAPSFQSCQPQPSPSDASLPLWQTLFTDVLEPFASRPLRKRHNVKTKRQGGKMDVKFSPPRKCSKREQFPVIASHLSTTKSRDNPPQDQFSHHQVNQESLKPCLHSTCGDRSNKQFPRLFSQLFDLSQSSRNHDEAPIDYSIQNKGQSQNEASQRQHFRSTSTGATHKEFESVRARQHFYSESKSPEIHRHSPSPMNSGVSRDFSSPPDFSLSRSPSTSPYETVPSPTPLITSVTSLDTTVVSWTPDDVAAFVTRATGCHEYEEIFKKQYIDGEVLLKLSDEHLMQVIKMKLGHLYRLRTTMEKLHLAL